MQRTSFADFACSAARTLDIFGEWWTPLILRDIFLGVTRFDKIQEDLGLPRRVLTERLNSLVAHEVLERRPYLDGRTRYEYVLTPRGRDFVTTLVALMNWGDHWIPDPHGPPIRVVHEACGGDLKATLTCQVCGKSAQAEAARTLPGPGARVGKGTAFVGKLAQRGRPKKTRV